MRHYILTRSAYGHGWRHVENARRLELLRRVTAPSIRAQTDRDFTWVVALSIDDPYYSVRREIVRSIGGYVLPLDGRATDRGAAARAAYKASWRSMIPGNGAVATTRLDDDDAIAYDFVARLRTFAYHPEVVSVALAPIGYRVAGGRVEEVERPTIGFQTMFAPSGDRRTIYDIPHKRVHEFVPHVAEIDRDPAWLWVRHGDTISGKSLDPGPRAITDDVRARFSIDWRAVGG